MLLTMSLNCWRELTTVTGISAGYGCAVVEADLVVR